ncbi:MAG: hypothetical protein R2736_02885 [Solirubrobacterales bacterium]
MFTIQLNHEALRHGTATQDSRRVEHLVEYHTTGPPARRRRDVRRAIAGRLARIARRLDGEAARRAIA